MYVHLQKQENPSLKILIQINTKIAKNIKCCKFTKYNKLFLGEKNTCMVTWVIYKLNVINHLACYPRY